jgi:PAS domain S-box-containing protein
MKDGDTGDARPRDCGLDADDLRLENLELRDALGALEPRYGVGAARYAFAPVACCGLDASGNIMDMNVAGGALLGSPEAAIVGRPLSSFVLAADQDLVREHVRSCLARDARTVTEVRVLREAGPPAPVQIISTPLLSPGGATVALVTVLVDASASSALRELSHDIRDELTTILLTATRALLSVPPIDATAARDAMQRIRKAAEKMRQRVGVAQATRPGHEARDAGAALPTAPRREGSGLVLIVDDDVQSRSVLEDLLCWHGYAVVPVATVDEALEYIGTGPVRPQVVVLDLNLPGRDGWAFLAERTRHPVLRSIPVLVASGQADIEHRVTAANAYFVSKPLSFEDAIEGIARAISLGPTIPADGRWRT